MQKQLLEFRAVSDFEYEFQLAGMNKKLNSKLKLCF